MAWKEKYSSLCIYVWYKLNNIRLGEVMRTFTYIFSPSYIKKIKRQPAFMDNDKMRERN
jgi:hypothetical protein